MIFEFGRHAPHGASGYDGFMAVDVDAAGVGCLAGWPRSGSWLQMREDDSVTKQNAALVLAVVVAALVIVTLVMNW